MKKVLFLLIFFIYSTNIHSSNIKYKIIVSINNDAITNLDLQNELEIIKILNKVKDSNLNRYKNIALINLIDEKIKEQELKKEINFIDNKTLENYFVVFKKNTKIDLEQINKNYIKLIKQKIKIDTSWNNLIAKKYSWKININMQEIQNKISQLDKKLSNEEIKKFQEDLILKEKNNKLLVFSKFHLNKLKKLSLIKYY